MIRTQEDKVDFDFVFLFVSSIIIVESTVGFKTQKEQTTIRANTMNRN